MAKKIEITPDVRDILTRSTFSMRGTTHVLNLPDEQLARPRYDAVMKVIKAAEGKWKKGTGHVFERDPRGILGLALETGVVVNEKKERQAFYTPESVANWLGDVADVEGQTVLEPSAGGGALVKGCVVAGAALVNCIELDEVEAEKLRANKIGLKCLGYVQQGDFLKMLPEHDDLYTRIVMNPPFTKGQDKKHITHALKWLREDGMIFAIVPDKDIEIPGGRVEVMERLQAGAFKSSGTEIRTRFIKVTHA